MDNQFQGKVVVKQLRKVFDKVVAVDRVSFGIKEGQIFTLLGVNGAGKTTTFKMLTGEIIPSAGDAFINNISISKNQAKCRKYIGYCPQFDALLPLLTSKQHLDLFAGIKGIPFNKREAMINDIIEKLGLKEFKNINSENYSGGNKRKLCVAIAILGNPQVVFLDEPSTGMDPGSKRFMWQVIEKISRDNKCSVLLTTHSMEEAEALSNQIAIQVDGQLKCVGSLQDIKQNFGDGYEIEINTIIPSKEKIEQFKREYQIEQQILEKGQLKGVLQKIGHENLEKEFSEQGSANALYQQLQVNKLNVDIFISFILTEIDGNNVYNFLKSQLGVITIIEKFNQNFKFKNSGTTPIYKIFSILEENKNQLNIKNYSVKQTTIEQIFNLFAQNKIQVNGYLKKEQQQQELQEQPETLSSAMPSKRQGQLIQIKQKSENQVSVNEN